MCTPLGCGDGLLRPGAVRYYSLSGEGSDGEPRDPGCSATVIITARSVYFIGAVLFNLHGSLAGWYQRSRFTDESTDAESSQIRDVYKATKRWGQDLSRT